MTSATAQERILRDDEFIVSKTDPKGRITYGNRTFIDFSGYSERELLGQPQNIIRHPDMPRAIFRLFWQTLQAGEEFNGYIKNRSKDGHFYWVFANVTPSLAPDGSLLGYHSVRRRARPEALAVIEPLYRDMLAAEQQSTGDAAMDAALAVLDARLEGKDYARFVLEI